MVERSQTRKKGEIKHKVWKSFCNGIKHLKGGLSRYLVFSALTHRAITTLSGKGLNQIVNTWRATEIVVVQFIVGFGLWTVQKVESGPLHGILVEKTYGSH